MCEVFISYCQPIRFARLDDKSMNHRLPVLDQPRALNPCHRSDGSWAPGTRMPPTKRSGNGYGYGMASAMRAYGSISSG